MNTTGEIPKYSLNQIRKDVYVELYDKLKVAYVPELKKIWKEKTDPDKFIHEDVGIASYLMTMWNFDSLNPEQRPNFVDIGCGNGLLTYLLSGQGFDGFGFDVRERKIWKSFTPQPRLIISSFNPADDKLLRDCNGKTWLIGNHPDELTPWIPIMARKFRCNFFIIPCCSYDFIGKYKRESFGKGSSVYSSYLQYVKKIALDCGFKIVFDRLRIPSTKRTCLIGILDEEVLRDPLRSESTLNYCETIIRTNTEASAFSQKFEPRCAVEPVRNCTKIGDRIISNTVKTLFNHLVHDLEEKNNILIACTPPSSDHADQVVWNAGKQDLRIVDAIKIIPDEYRKQMKAQHGGFQTLIKNHGHIFRIVNGYVRLRQPHYRDIELVQNSLKLHTKRCYLYDHHPQRCPLPSTYCKFIH